MLRSAPHLRRGALLIRGPSSDCVWVPALRSGASAPHRVRDTLKASVRSALRRRGRPRLDQRVVVDGFALRLLVRQLALGRDVAVLCRLREPELGRLLLVELRPARALDAGFLET